MAEGNGCDRDYKDPQSVNYLQSHPLQKKFIDPWTSKRKKYTSFLFVFVVCINEKG